GLELEYLEFSDKRRRVDEDIVIIGEVSIAFLLEAGVNLPSAGRVVFNSTRHMLLPDDVHEGRRRSEVGHLVGELCREDLIPDFDIFGSLFNDTPCLFIDLLPHQWLIPDV